MLGSDNEESDSGSYGVSELEKLEEESGSAKVEGSKPSKKSQKNQSEEDSKGVSAKEIINLKDSVDRLINIFEKAEETIEEEDDVSSRVDRVLEQNKQIANGMIKLASLVRNLDSKVDSLQSTSPRGSPTSNSERNSTAQSGRQGSKESEQQSQPLPPKPAKPPSNYHKGGSEKSNSNNNAPKPPQKKGKKSESSEIPEPPKKKGFFSRMMK